MTTPRKKTPTLAGNFATNLKASRRRLGMSQHALAVGAGVSVSYISMLERGQRTPPLPMIEQLARPMKLHPLSLLHVPTEQAVAAAA